MKVTPFIYCILLVVGFGKPLSGQEGAGEPDSKWALTIQTGIQASKYHHPFYFNIICIEGCEPVAVHWKFTTTVDLGLQYQLTDRHWLRLGAAYSEYGYQEEIKDNWLLDTYSREINFQFFAVELASGWEFLRWNRVGLFTEQGLRLETPIDDDYDELKAVNWSYQGRLGGQYQMSSTISLRLNANFKTAIGRYNREEVGFDFYQNYHPFAIGGELGVLVHL